MFVWYGNISRSTADMLLIMRPLNVKTHNRTTQKNRTMSNTRTVPIRKTGGERMCSRRVSSSSYVTYMASAICRCSARLYLQLLLGRFMSYLRCLCLFAYTGSGVQHILCCVFVLSFMVLCTLWCQFLLTVGIRSWLPLLMCSRRVSSSSYVTYMASAICKVCTLYESYYRKQIILDALGACLQ
jgi:hypothetical protein